MMTLGAGDQLTAFNLRSTDGSATSDPFVVPEDASVMGVHIHTDADNSWVYVSTELIDVALDETAGVLGDEVGYYHGSEGGESWSEGSKSRSRYLQAPPPGTYQISVETESDRDVSVRVRVTIDDRLTRYPMGLAVLLLLPAGVIAYRWKAFESARWDEED